jgi:hypothetical protein
VQLGLQALYALKEGLHQAYETLREAGVRPTHIGAATVSASSLAKSGCLQKFVASGTAIAPEQCKQLVTALAAPQCRITVLELASCTGLEGQRLDELLSAAVCTALGTAGVTRIRLTGNKLADSIATVLESLANSCHRLEYLGLGGNACEGPIPAAIGRLRRLTFLALNGSNGIVGMIPAEIGQLERLEFLYLHKTQISGSIPAAIGRCTALKQLDVSETTVCGTIPAEIGQLGRLKGLYLHKTQIGGSIPAAIRRCTTLSHLLVSVRITNFAQTKQQMPAVYVAQQ